MTRVIGYEIDEALGGLTRRQIEDLIEKAQHQLQACIVCGDAPSVFCQIKAEKASVQGNALRFGIDLCTACISKYRRPHPAYSRQNGKMVRQDAAQP